MIAAQQRARVVSIWERFVTGVGLTVTLAVLLVLAVTLPIYQANWVPGMFPLPVTGVASALLTAWLLGMRKPGWSVWAWSTGIGIAVIYSVGAAMLHDQPGAVRWFTIIGELSTWFGAIGNKSVQSGLPEFAMLLSFLAWLLGYLAVWMAIRMHQAWAAVILGGVTLTIALSQSGVNTTVWLGLFMAAGVLILIHVAIAQRMVGWRLKHLGFESSTVLWQSLIVLVAGVVIIGVVSVLPAPTWSPLAGVTRTFSGVSNSLGDQFSRLFNGLPSRRHVHTLTFDPTTHFQGNPHLSPDIIFTVEGPANGADYWRARAYTTYSDTGWASGTATWGTFEESGATDLKRTPAQFHFDVSAATDSFFTAGLPASFDQPVQGLAPAGARSDTLQVRFVEGREYYPTRTNVRYTSVGNRSTANATDLKATAGMPYPSDILNTYTQLPRSLPQRVLALADFVTRGLPTEYDKAIAVQNYLLHIPYNLNIQAPPAGEDGVDYFLFDSRQGYCDYFASAMAVMLRAVGVPARYVLGYTTGRPDTSASHAPGDQVWDVAELNYHAWTEVYFPEYGWMRFEPTPAGAIEFGGQANQAPPPALSNQPTITGPIPQDEEDTGGAISDTSPTPTPFISAGRILLAVLAVVVVALAVFFYRWWWRLARYPKADELYAKMGKLATLLGLPPEPASTPAEYAAALATEVPEYADSFQTISRVYSLRRYGGRMISMADIRQAEQAWTRMRWRLVRRLFRVRTE